MALPITSSVLYMPMPTPPAGKSYTAHSVGALPSLGVKTILKAPARSTTKSVDLYCKDGARTGLNRRTLEEIPSPPEHPENPPGRRGHVCLW